MSRPIDRRSPSSPSGRSERERGVRREGDLLGLQYELGFRVSDLMPPEATPEDAPASLRAGLPLQPEPESRS